MLSIGAGAGPSGEPLFPETAVVDGTAGNAATNVDDDVMTLEEEVVVFESVGGCFFFFDLFRFFLLQLLLVAEASVAAVTERNMYMNV